MTPEDSPFKVGTKCAKHVYILGLGTRITVVYVDKVYKNGNFVLKNDTQQWRPIDDGRAWPTGNAGYRRPFLKIWSKDTENDIQKLLAEQNRKDRIQQINIFVANLDPTDIASEVDIYNIEVAIGLKEKE